MAPSGLLTGHPIPHARTTSTMRDSSCSTDSGSRLCTAALSICLFIRLYLCRARWCLCSTPFSCRSHRSCGEGQLRSTTGQKGPRATLPP